MKLLLLVAFVDLLGLGLSRIGGGGPPVVTQGFTKGSVGHMSLGLGLRKLKKADKSRIDSW